MNEPTNTNAGGRPIFWLGLLLTFGAPLAFAVSMATGGTGAGLWLPWVTGAGALLLVLAFVQRRSLGRGLLMALGVLVAVLVATGMSMMTLPDYTGPAKAGTELPAFEALRADGSPFRVENLRDGKRRVLVFYRGWW